jgi:MFS family permease
LRLIQGIGVGGEWGGSVLLAMEWARTNKNRGFIAHGRNSARPPALSGNGEVLLFSAISAIILHWGWRSRS